MSETWLPIPGFPGYEVSDMGRVKSYLGKLPRILKPGNNQDGYKIVGLWKEKKPHTLTVHRLVALAFLGPRPDGMQVCHGDGIRSNNHLSNLRYDTVSANFEDMIVQRLIARWDAQLPTPIEAKEQA